MEATAARMAAGGGGHEREAFWDELYGALAAAGLRRLVSGLAREPVAHGARLAREAPAGHRGLDVEGRGRARGDEGLALHRGARSDDGPRRA